MLNISSEPIKQSIGCFVHLQAEGRDRSPMLLATVVGCHYFQVFGAAWDGSKVCIDPLCSPVSLLFVPRDPNYGVSKTARLLSAMCSTVDELKKYYECPQRDRTIQKKGPYFCQDLHDMKQMGRPKWLFEAKHNGENVVYFSRKSTKAITDEETTW